MHDNKKPNKVERPISANMFSWLEKENSTRNIIYLLGAVCAFLFAFDFVYNRYGHFTIEIDGQNYSEDIGIRIEDNLLITDTGSENLSQEIPKDMKDIEALLS